MIKLYFQDFIIRNDISDEIEDLIHYYEPHNVLPLRKYTIFRYVVVNDNVKFKNKIISTDQLISKVTSDRTLDVKAIKPNDNVELNIEQFANYISTARAIKNINDKPIVRESRRYERRKYPGL